MHKSTDVGVFVLQLPAVVVHDLIQLTTVNLACVSLKLETADENDTCHLQMAVDLMNRKVNERC